MLTGAPFVLFAMLSADTSVSAMPGGHALRFVTPFSNNRGVGAAFDFAQTADAAVWISGFRLARWKGFEAVYFGSASVDGKSDYVFGVTPDGGGGVWAGLAGRAAACEGAVPCDAELPQGVGLSHLGGGPDVHLASFPDGLDANVWAVAMRGGRLWIGTRDGVLRYDAGRFTRFTRNSGLVEPFVTALAVDQNGQLIVGTRQGVQVLSGERFGPEFSTGLVSDLAVGGDGVRWVATRNGLWRWGTTGPPTRLGKPDGLPTDDVRAVDLDREGTLWIATAAGLAGIDPGGGVFVVPVPGLADRKLIAVRADDEGGVWIGTRAHGFLRGEPSIERQVGREQGLPFDEAIAVVRAGDDIFSAGADGTLAAITGGGIRAYRLPDGGAPTLLAADPGGRVWMAAPDRGLYVLDRGVAGPVANARPDPADRNITALLAPTALELWVASADGGLRVYESGKEPRGNPGLRLTRAIDLARAGCRGSITAIAQGSDRTTWLVSSEGWLARVRNEDVRCLDPGDGKSRRNLVDVAVDEQGSVWLADMHSWLVRYRDGRFAAFNENDGLVCDTIAKLVPDGRGHLWTACEGGIARTDLGELWAAEPVRRFSLRPLRFMPEPPGPSYAASFKGRPAAALDAGGRLWVATPLGLTVIDNPEHRRLPPAPQIAAINLTVSGRRIAGPGSTTMVVGNAVQFTPELTALTQPAGVRLRYEVALDDRTTQVRQTGPEAATLPVDSPGRYRIVARASNAYGVWGPDSAPVTLDVLPRWQDRPSTWLGLAGALVVLGFALLTLRTRQTAARVAAIERERERLARDLHDHLGQDFASLGYHLESLAVQLVDNPAKAAQTLASTQAVLRSAQDDTRRAIWKLRSRELVGGTIVDGLRALVASERAMGRRCALEIEDNLVVDDVQIEGEFLQVAREAVTNAGKHAAASMVQIDLVRVGPELRLRVSDNGIGFALDPEGAIAAGHFGILGMRERLRRLGGSLEVDSQPGSGTVVQARVSLVKGDPG